MGMLQGLGMPFTIKKDTIAEVSLLNRHYPSSYQRGGCSPRHTDLLVLLLLEHVFNVSLHILGLGHGREALDDATVFRDEELGEVPTDLAVLAAFCLAQAVDEFHRGLVLQAVDFFVRHLFAKVSKDGMGVLAEDVDFFHQREGHAVVQAAELRNFFVAAGFLVFELVTGKAEDDQPLVLILLVEGFQAIVLRGEAALRSRVNNHEDFAFVLGHVHLFALVVQGLEIVNRSHFH